MVLGVISSLYSSLERIIYLWELFSIIVNPFPGGVLAPHPEVLAGQEVDLLPQGGGQRVEGPAPHQGPRVLTAPGQA